MCSSLEEQFVFSFDIDFRVDIDFLDFRYFDIYGLLLKERQGWD
jgi:hypothetical protein